MTGDSTLAARCLGKRRVRVQVFEDLVLHDLGQPKRTLRDLASQVLLEEFLVFGLLVGQESQAFLGGGIRNAPYEVEGKRLRIYKLLFIYSSRPRVKPGGWVEKAPRGLKRLCFSTRS